MCSYVCSCDSVTSLIPDLGDGGSCDFLSSVGSDADSDGLQTRPSQLRVASISHGDGTEGD